MSDFTKATRRAVCVHEAAHAVIHALGGAFIYRVAVAPEGCEEWSIESRKGGVIQTDLWGVCQASDPPGLHYLDWYEPDEFGGTYRSRLEEWRFIRSQLSLCSRRFMNRNTRVHVCGLLAGPIASQIWHGCDIDVYPGPLADGWGPGSDIAKAAGLATLLERPEYDYLAELTEATLRRPDVWAMVLRLADELEQVGDIEEFPGLLPEEVPGWPPSSRAKRVQVFALAPCDRY
ncbi:hypothetical protein F6X40_19890 [Paraburkholderia sp. UCT31]|uniref:hypothetical protein n=1 Tax=Paraburkholderia sp. UCT31 TaxID=2615209 RepID=UPI00165598E1|nr:hypothetical protein [Paraburkholderia sp. UCT31]MBC8739018.1 hypothetical protein [Paraburkholderia sp. UCT31]